MNLLKKLTSTQELQLIIILDQTLIGGFFIKFDSKILDYTIKNQLNLLTNYLNN